MCFLFSQVQIVAIRWWLMESIITWWSSVGLQVSEVRMVRMMKVVKVNPQAERVPRGMDLAGDSSSPDRFAPAMIPSKRHTGINEIVELFIRNVGTIT